MNKTATLLATAALIGLAGCAKKPPKQLPPAPPSETTTTTTTTPPVAENNGPTPGSRADFVAQAGSDTVHFATDSSDIDAEATSILTKQAAWLAKFPNVRVTIEGHCDERGTAEYNLALGERRAVAVKTYLVALGIAPDRMRTVSYGKEFPFDPGHTEASWYKNRRAQFVITSK